MISRATRTVILTQDTTASTLSWLFYELSRDPNVVEKIRREINHYHGVNGIPISDDLRNLKYSQVRLMQDIFSFDLHTSLCPSSSRWLTTLSK